MFCFAEQVSLHRADPLSPFRPAPRATTVSFSTRSDDPAAMKNGAIPCRLEYENELAAWP
jgi:hypothetical protein